MVFDFQTVKPVICAEFDEVMKYYPGDTSEILKRLKECHGDSLERKLAVIEAAAELCPVHVFGHFPFAFEIDAGYRRDCAWVGVGQYCYIESGIDFKPLHEFRSRLCGRGLGTFNDFFDCYHRTVDYDLLFSCGYRGIYDECVRLNSTEAVPEKRRYREAIMRVCLAIKKLGERLREKAALKLETAEDEVSRYNLKRIAESANTPWEAPKTMFDALNVLLCCTLWSSVLDGISMNSLGQVDRLLYPFYKADVESGRLTDEEAYFMLQCFLFKTDAHSAFSPEHTSFDSSVTVMIGGCDRFGAPVYNRITDMILDSYAENNYCNPKLNARASTDSPREYLKRLADLILMGKNNMIVENDDHVIPMFTRMGLDIDDARRYIGGGCQEVVAPNQKHNRAFAYISLPKILLDTIYEEDDSDRIYRYGRFKKNNFDELYESFLMNLRSYIQVLAEKFHVYEARHYEISPEPVLSCLTADCVANALDITQGGSRYNHNTLSLVGFGTLCDSLLALRRAYSDGKIDELIAATRDNFNGYSRLRAELLHSDNRFGKSDEADEFARDLAERLAEVSHGIYTESGVEWHTSLFAYYLFKNFGESAGATPDGRCSHEPFSRGMNMASLGDLTQMALSISKICGAEFDDVGVFDLTLPLAQGDKYVEAVTNYIAVCVKLKIPVLQLNVVDREKLIEERNHKGTHPEIVVRVCGYSAVFGLLNTSMQDEIISRAE